ncbi:hypothetical protein [Negadavirga shengliensis]|uniref:Tetratricopeptide repeat protein n=1 Tax=Negadavirga shengliensis TaxID=1389218 RepID=A0ABV9T006_9BACT
MKKYLILILLLILISLVIKASNETYIQAMSSEIARLEKAATIEDLQRCANAFARIQGIHPNEWHPLYYSSLAYTYMGFMTNGGLEAKDKYFAEAKRLVDRAAGLSSGNSEIMALKGFVLMGELSADPQSRGADMGAITLQTLEKAAALNPNNPRALILLAQMEYGTSQFFGQSTEKACKLAKTSSELFNQEKAKNRNNMLEPRWGKEMIEQLVGACENAP